MTWRSFHEISSIRKATQMEIRSVVAKEGWAKMEEMEVTAKGLLLEGVFAEG